MPVVAGRPVDIFFSKFSMKTKMMQKTTGEQFYIFVVFSVYGSRYNSEVTKCAVFNVANRSLKLLFWF